jgi:hypothetical protein
MTFRVIVIPPQKVGDPYESEPGPIPNRQAAAMSALWALRKNGVTLKIGGLTFARLLSTADLGATVTDEESGYSFRTEEYTS